MSSTQIIPSGIDSTATFTFANVSVTGNITVTNKSNLGSNSNVIITGGSSGQSLTTDGAGNLSWASGGGGGGTSVGKSIILSMIFGS